MEIHRFIYIYDIWDLVNSFLCVCGVWGGGGGGEGEGKAGGVLMKREKQEEGSNQVIYFHIVAPILQQTSMIFIKLFY